MMYEIAVTDDFFCLKEEIYFTTGKKIHIQ